MSPIHVLYLVLVYHAKIKLPEVLGRLEVALENVMGLSSSAVVADILVPTQGWWRSPAPDCPSWSAPDRSRHLYLPLPLNHLPFPLHLGSLPENHPLSHIQEEQSRQGASNQSPSVAMQPKDCELLREALTFVDFLSHNMLCVSIYAATQPHDATCTRWRLGVSVIWSQYQFLPCSRSPLER